MYTYHINTHVYFYTYSNHNQNSGSHQTLTEALNAPPRSISPRLLSCKLNSRIMDIETSMAAMSSTPCIEALSLPLTLNFLPACARRNRAVNPKPDAGTRASNQQERECDVPKHIEQGVGLLLGPELESTWHQRAMNYLNPKTMSNNGQVGRE